MTAQELLENGFVAILRNIDSSLLHEAVQAAFDAGVRLFELTFDMMTPNPVCDFQTKMNAISFLKEKGAFFGAGTVLTPEQVRTAFDAGCEFIVSPGTDAEVVNETKRLGMLSIPGCMTPTEIMTAWKLGADIIKVFPADDIGFHFFANLRGPLPHIPLMATGGVNPATIPELLALGVKSLGAGATIFKQELLETKDFQAIYALAKAHVDAFASVKRGNTK